MAWEPLSNTRLLCLLSLVIVWLMRSQITHYSFLTQFLNQLYELVKNMPQFIA